MKTKALIATVDLVAARVKPEVLAKVIADDAASDTPAGPEAALRNYVAAQVSPQIAILRRELAARERKERLG